MTHVRTDDPVQELVPLMHRRDFVQVGAAGILGLLISACAGEPITAPTVQSLVITISDYSALANVGGMAKVSSNPPVAVVRTGDTTFDAFSLVCPHQGGSVGIVGGSSFLCSNHSAQFAKDGSWTGGQKTSNLFQYQTTFAADTGELTIQS